MKVEIQLGQLECVKHSRSGSSSQMRDMIPTARCMPMSQGHEEYSTLSAQGAKPVPSPHAPVDPPEASTVLTSSPKLKVLKISPFGLSIVVEDAASGGAGEPEGSVCSAKELESPTRNRSPPSSPRDPEGSVVGDIGSPTSYRGRSPSYNSLPLPVATPVGQCRAASRSLEVAE